MEKQENRGGRKKGQKNKLTKNIKEAVESAFIRVGGVAYLETVARDDPRTFCALIAKIIPATVALDITHKIDLGLAMRESQQNLERLNQKIIDVTPAKPAKSLITKDK